MNGRNVYVVDDEGGMRKALARLLRSGGYAVCTFSSAEEFLAVSRKEEVGCLILDVDLPGLDGLTLQQELNVYGGAPPIIFLTGNGDIPMSVKAIKAGALDFLTKPVNDEDLLRAVEAALTVSGTRSAERAGDALLRVRYESLTPREREVMGKVVAGLLNKQIAAEFGTGEQNIKIHRGRVMEKMGVQSLPDLVRAAQRLGAGPTPGGL